jgi:hypothetical protein
VTPTSRTTLLAAAAMFLTGCRGIRRPTNLPSSAVWAHHIFIDCSADTQDDANRRTVYKEDTGEILADGLFTLTPLHGATRSIGIVATSFSLAARSMAMASMRATAASTHVPNPSA